MKSRRRQRRRRRSSTSRRQARPTPLAERLRREAATCALLLVLCPRFREIYRGGRASRDAGRRMETTLSPPLFFFPTRWATSSSLGKCDSPPSPLRLLRPLLRWRVEVARANQSASLSGKSESVSSREQKERTKASLPFSLSLFLETETEKGKKSVGSLALSFLLDRSEDEAEERRVPPLIRPASNRPLHSHAPARERSPLSQDCSSSDERTQESQARLLAKRQRSDFSFDVCCRCCCLVDRRLRRRRREERRQRRPALVPPCPGLPQPRARRFL